jgi:hypothetical protein
MVVHHAIDVKAAPDECWRTFAELADWPKWFPLCKNVRSLDGNPWKLGNRIEIVFQPGFPVVVKVEELEPAKIVRWRGGRLGMTGNHSYTFSVNSTGLTRVTSHEEFSGLASKWIPRAVVDRLDGEVHRSMERFKALVEG